MKNSKNHRNNFDQFQNFGFSFFSFTFFCIFLPLLPSFSPCYFFLALSPSPLSFLSLFLRSSLHFNLPIVLLRALRVPKILFFFPLIFKERKLIFYLLDFSGLPFFPRIAGQFGNPEKSSK